MEIEVAEFVPGAGEVVPFRRLTVDQTMTIPDESGEIPEAEARPRRDEPEEPVERTTSAVKDSLVVSWPAALTCLPKAKQKTFKQQGFLDRTGAIKKR